jgi:hypothetical protein
VATFCLLTCVASTALRSEQPSTRIEATLLGRVLEIEGALAPLTAEQQGFLQKLLSALVERVRGHATLAKTAPCRTNVSRADRPVPAPPRVRVSS